MPTDRSFVARVRDRVRVQLPMGVSDLNNAFIRATLELAAEEVERRNIYDDTRSMSTKRDAAERLRTLAREVAS